MKSKLTLFPFGTAVNSIAGSSPGGDRTRSWNRWRDRYNPLRGLNIARGVSLLEQYQRGEMADPQWAYFFIEQSDADLFAILERRQAALLQLDWNIKSVAGSGLGSPPRLPDAVLAEEQAAALREAYDGLDNLYEAIAVPAHRRHNLPPRTGQPMEPGPRPPARLVEV